PDSPDSPGTTLLLACPFPWMAHPLVAPAKALGGIPASFPDSPADTERSGAESRQYGSVSLIDHLPDGTADPDTLFDAFASWAEERGLTLYPHQEEALIEVVSGSNVILNTPTGSGKSLVATGAIFAALARDECSFYTAPIKALVSEKFFDLCEIFGTENVGMMTGDASVNSDAPIVCCTAEV